MIVSVNGVVVIATSGSTEFAAAQELLRQRAVTVGLLAEDETGADEVDVAIERLLADEVTVPTPTEDECRCHYDMHRQDFTSGDLVHARHILFQVTPAVHVLEIRARAENTLNQLLAEPERFAELAAELSNCPSGQQGGNLGQIGRGDTVPEFEKALFRLNAGGILSELVKTRYGFHIVAVDKSLPGSVLPLETVYDEIAETLKGEVEESALRQYISILAGQAEITGARIEAAHSPLVQ